RIYGHVKEDAYASELKERVQRYGLGDRFSFAGFKADAPAIMSEIDVLVHPCDVESFGRVVIEAMGAALPVVGARGGGVAETVDDQKTGLLSAPDDADALAPNIEALVSDAELRRSMGAR